MKNITKLSALLLIAGIVLANNTLIAAGGGGEARPSPSMRSHDSAASITSRENWTALHEAVQTRKTEQLEELLKTATITDITAYCDLVYSNGETRTGMTALHLAAETGNTHAVRKLLAAIRRLDRDNAQKHVTTTCTATYDGKTWSGLTALHLAANKNENIVISILLNSKEGRKCNTDCTITFPEGEEQSNVTALHLAAEKGMTLAVVALLEKSCTNSNDYRISKKNNIKTEDTALHLAIRFGHDHTVQALLQSHDNPVDVALNSIETDPGKLTKEITTLQIAASLKAGAIKDTIQRLLSKATSPKRAEAAKSFMAPVAPAITPAGGSAGSDGSSGGGGGGTGGGSSDSLRRRPGGSGVGGPAMSSRAEAIRLKADGEAFRRGHIVAFFAETYKYRCLKAASRKILRNTRLMGGPNTALHKEVLSYRASVDTIRALLLAHQDIDIHARCGDIQLNDREAGHGFTAEQIARHIKRPDFADLIACFKAELASCKILLSLNNPSA